MQRQVIIGEDKRCQKEKHCEEEMMPSVVIIYSAMSIPIKSCSYQFYHHLCGIGWRLIQPLVGEIGEFIPNENKKRINWTNVHVHLSSEKWKVMNRKKKLTTVLYIVSTYGETQEKEKVTSPDKTWPYLMINDIWGALFMLLSLVLFHMQYMFLYSWLCCVIPVAIWKPLL